MLAADTPQSIFRPDFDAPIHSDGGFSAGLGAEPTASTVPIPAGVTFMAEPTTETRVHSDRVEGRGESEPRDDPPPS